MSTLSCTTSRNEHADFLKLAPVIEHCARFAFRDRNPDAKEEAVAEATAAAFQSYVALKGRGIDAARRFSAAMANFAILHVKCDRHVGGRESSKCVMSRKAQRKHRFQVHSLTALEATHSREDFHPCHEKGDDVFEAQVKHDAQTPVPDQAAFRIDFPAFLRKLAGRDQMLAKFLALGNSGKKAAQQFKLSPGRVTQLRQQWYREWLAFHGESSRTECVSA